MKIIILNIVHNLDWIAYGLILFGNYKVGKGSIDGWLISAYGSLLAILWGISIGKYGVSFWNIWFCVVFVFSYTRMRKLMNQLTTLQYSNKKDKENDENSVSK